MNQTYRLILDAFQKRRWQVLGVGLLTLFTTLLTLPTPLLTSQIIDRCLPEKNLELLGMILIIILVVLILQASLGYLLKNSNSRLNETIVQDIKHQLLLRLLGAPIAETRSHGSGYLLSRIDHDGNQIRLFMAETLFQALRGGLTFLVGGIAICIIHWKLALMTLAILPTYAFLIAYYAKRVRQAAEEQNETRAQTINSLQEALDGLGTCKALNAEDYAASRYDVRAQQGIAAFLSLVKVQAASGAFIGIVSGIAPVLVLGYGVYEILQGNLTLGKMIAFTQFVAYLFEPTRLFVNLHISYAQARSAIDRIETLLGLPQEIPSYQDAPIHHLEVTAIRYSIGEKTILRNISLKAYRGQIIGILGPSGAGKTTLAQILCGYLPASSGTIRINDNKPENAASFSRLRHHCALVEQDPFIFDDSLIQNVALSEIVNHRLLIESLTKAQALDFSNNLEHGLETPLKKRGSRLSAGQRQRIAIARALYRQTDIIVFDEATANLDYEASQLLLEVIKNLAQTHIVFIISHQSHVIESVCSHRIYIEDGTLLPPQANQKEPPVAVMPDFALQE